MRPLLLTLCIAAAAAFTAPIASAAPQAGAKPAVAPSSGRISVRVVGRGPDVVLIPGLGGSPEIWDDTVRRLRSRARLHLVHVSGFAGAPAGANADGPVLEPVADEIAAYLRGRRLGPVKLVGHSTGGKLALMTAAREPGRVSGVMVVDMLPFFGLVLNPAARGAADVRPFAEGARRGVLAADETRFRAEQAAAAARYARLPRSREAALRGVLASDRRVYAQAMGELISTDLRPTLPSMTAPVTVLYAPGDNVVGFPVRDADALYRTSYAGLPGARLIAIPDSGHLLMDDQPERFAREFDAFLRR